MSISDYIEPVQKIFIYDTLNLNISIPEKGVDRDVDVEVILNGNTVLANGEEKTEDFIIKDEAVTILENTQ